jgi:hypothetical protein
VPEEKRAIDRSGMGENQNVCYQTALLLTFATISLPALTTASGEDFGAPGSESMPGVI